MDQTYLCPCGGTREYRGRHTVRLDEKPWLGELTGRPTPVELYICPRCGRMELRCPGEDTELDTALDRLAGTEEEALRRALRDPGCTPAVRAAARQLLNEKG